METAIRPRSKEENVVQDDEPYFTMLVLWEAV